MSDDVGQRDGLLEAVMTGKALVEGSAPWDQAEAQRIVGQLREQVERQQVLVELAKVTASDFLDVKKLLRHIVSKAKEVVQVDRTSLYLYDDKRNMLWTMIAEGLEDTSQKFITLPMGEGVAGWSAVNRQIAIVNDAYADPRFHPAIDQRTGYRTHNLLATPMMGTNGKFLGVLQVINKLSGLFTPEDGEYLLAVGSFAAMHLETAYLCRDLEMMFDPFINMVAHAVDERDATTAGHSRRVMEYSRAIAEAINKVTKKPLGDHRFAPDELRQLEIAALLHDVGKIGVRESVLNKSKRLNDQDLKIVVQRLEIEIRQRKLELIQAGVSLDPQTEVEVHKAVEFLKKVSSAGHLTHEDRERLEEIYEKGWLEACEFEHLSVSRGNLTAEEWEHMMSHVTISHNLLSQIHWPRKFRRVPEIAYCHHEKLNGMGYPRGLRAGDISIEAQIVTVADIYDALTAHDRPYKPPMPHERAANILIEQANGGFINADIVQLFLRERLHLKMSMKW